MENFGRCCHNFSACLGLIIAEEYTMKRLLRQLAIASLAVAGFAAVASAQTAPPVVENQRARIRQGVRDGSLTRREAAGLRGRERRLQRRANRDRRNGVSPGEKNRLRRQARRDSRAIGRLRRNNRAL